MKNISFFARYSAFLCVVFALLLVTCKKDKKEHVPNGMLSVNIGISIESSNIYNSLKAANPDDFTVIIRNSEGGIVATYLHASDIPNTLELEEGNYTVEANSANNLPAAFDNPYYYGISGIVTVVAGATVTAEVNCTLANFFVTVIYSANVISDFSDYSVTVSNSGGTLVFGKSETRSGFFNAGPISIEANLYYIDGSGAQQTKTLTGGIPNPLPHMQYEIHIDASVTEGTAIINLNVDEGYGTEVITLTDESSSEGIQYGDLIITEIMYDPDFLTDTQGEWFEVQNVSATEINLKDLVILRTSNSSRHIIATDVIVAPGAFAVLARTATATVSPNYVYGTSITLPNTGEEISLNTYGTDGTNGLIICAVNYG
jgi:hypothetical protein